MQNIDLQLIDRDYHSNFESPKRQVCWRFVILVIHGWPRYWGTS